jgi:hypothetical protein
MSKIQPPIKTFRFLSSTRSFSHLQRCLTSSTVVSTILVTLLLCLVPSTPATRHCLTCSTTLTVLHFLHRMILQFQQRSVVLAVYYQIPLRCLRFLETTCVFSSSLSYSVSPSIQVINGTTVYSPAFYGGKNYTSASGEQLTFTSNSSGTYVSTNSSNTARIMRSDVLTSNGVVHVIDSVLCDTQSNPGVASSACVSIMCQCVIQY